VAANQEDDTLQRKQDQSGGPGSTNVQAGKDVVINVGITATEARDIALDVFKSNFLTMAGVAEQTVRERVEKITNEYLEQLEKYDPAGLASVQDPDMLQTIYNAQKGYACSGDEDLESALVDLLVERSGQTERNLKTLVLNQAIECLPKLTIGQRKAIAISFLVRDTGYASPLALPTLYRLLATNFAPFADIASNRLADYRYLQSAGIGSLSQFSLELEDAFWERFCGYLTKGFTPDQIPEQARQHIEDRSIFIPCLRNAETLQVNARSIADIQELQAQKGIQVPPGHAGPLGSACEYGRMTKPEIRQDIVSQLPFMAQLFDHWNGSGLGNFELTALGIAIGHAYWRRVTGEPTSLDDWL
jgi:hypothetical protein